MGWSGTCLASGTTNMSRLESRVPPRYDRFPPGGENVSCPRCGRVFEIEPNDPTSRQNVDPSTTSPDIVFGWDACCPGCGYTHVFVESHRQKRVFLPVGPDRAYLC